MDNFGSDEVLHNLQHTADKIQQKMQVSCDFAENLAKWHKDSHELTKNADGTKDFLSRKRYSF